MNDRLDTLAVPPVAIVDHPMMANAIRALAMDAVEAAKSGHPGMPMGMADVATVLFTQFLKFDPEAPDWADRDRFVLSAGHGSMLLYALLYLTGYPDMTLDELKRFRQLGSRTAGHPEYGHASGIETTTGPLGQGLGNAVGMALAERLLNARFGDHLVDHYTYVIAGDGDLMEGISHEAIDLAGHLDLSRLIVLFDDNHVSIDGPIELATGMDQLARFAAAGWSVRSVDGHDPQAVATAIAEERQTERPSLIACRTLIGYGAPTRAGTAKAHGEALGAEEVAGARVALGWPHQPFVVPEPILAAWRSAGKRGGEPRRAWEKRLAAAPDHLREQFTWGQAGKVAAASDAAILRLKEQWAGEKPKLATRQSSQKALEVLIPVIPDLLGGSADLTGSVGTRIAGHVAVGRADFAGSYIHYGVREHGMAAAMNGIALHRGFIPYGGTFLTFSDYSRPSIRLAALMGIRVIHILTHDSIGLGEDGPTHQPVEHLSALRAIPNLLVIRPADAIETAEAWAVALENETGPTALVLTRQGLPALRHSHVEHNLIARGGYLLHEPHGDRRVTLIASGSEVSLAITAAGALAAEGIASAVVSMPSMELFRRQPASYREAVLGSVPRVAVEAAVRQSWDLWLREGDRFIGMDGYGASAPGTDAFRHFGITAEAVAEAARQVAG